MSRDDILPKRLDFRYALASLHPEDPFIASVTNDGRVVTRVYFSPSAVYTRVGSWWYLCDLPAKRRSPVSGMQPTRAGHFWFQGVMRDHLLQRFTPAPHPDIEALFARVRELLR